MQAFLHIYKNDVKNRVHYVIYCKPRSTPDMIRITYEVLVFGVWSLRAYDIISFRWCRSLHDKKEEELCVFPMVRAHAVRDVVHILERHPCYFPPFPNARLVFS